MSFLRSVLFLQKAAYVKEQQEQVRRQIQYVFPGLEVLSASDPDEICSGIHVDAVITPTIEWLPEALAQLGSYRWIHFLSAGVERIWDMPFDKHNVILTKSSGVHGIPMSEYVLGAMLYFAKNFDQFVHQMAERRWQRAWLNELSGNTVTILGMGHVGEFVARRASAMGMRVVGVQRNPRNSEFAVKSVSMQSVYEILPDTDYLVVCLPLTELTRGLVDDKFIGELKKGSVIIDISRGEVVREYSILKALDSGHLRGAALDVFEEEPLQEDSELWARKNVLLTPHVSGTSPHYLQRAIDIFICNAHDLEAGRSLSTAINVHEGY